MRILGINVSIDSAAALVVDGQLVAAACEERFDRQKHSRAFPLQTIAWCLEHAGLGWDDLDAVASFWNPARQLEGLPGAQLARYRHHGEYYFQLPALLGRAAGGQRFARSRYTLTEIDRGAGQRPLRLYHVDHHTAHAQLAWRLSGWPEAAVLTLDGYGERDSGLLARAGADGLSELARIPFPHSIGSVYAAITEHLGFKPNSGEGKLMGLAAYGQPSFQPQLERILAPNAAGDGIEVDLAYFSYFQPQARRVSPRFIDAFGPPRQPGGPLEQVHMDLAASLQGALERCLERLAQTLHERTGLERLVYGGGVALNSLANGRLLERGPFAELFVPPACGDAGTAAGAALWVHEHLGGAPAPPPDTDALGPDVDVEALEALLARSGLHVSRPADMADHAAAAVAGGAIIGWFQGRMEFGPRALGHRSLVADPRQRATFERLNNSIKFREPFRPYAPAVLAERVGEFFEPAIDCPYMLKVLRVRPEAAARLPAITHEDGTARVQTVSREREPLYHAMISAFERHAGVPVVINTSFNVRGEPIVCRPEEALAMLARTGMDALAIGPFWVSKRGDGQR